MKVGPIAIHSATALTLLRGPLRYRRMDRGSKFTSTVKPNGFHGRSSLTCMARLFSLVVAAMAAVLIPGISNATTWNAVADFNSSAAWSYGQGTTGSALAFSAYSDFQTPCDAGVSGTSCWQIASGVPVPLVGINTTGGTLAFGTVVLPTDVLWMHPGPGASSDSIVRWTALAPGMYSISGFFKLLDTSPTGVYVGIYHNSALVHPAGLFGQGASDSFSFWVALLAGDVISFGVNNAGSHYNDSTGFNATITNTTSSVPEPTSLSLFASGLAGFWWLRKRRSKVLMRNC